MYNVTATQQKTIIDLETVMPDADNVDHIVNGKVEVEFQRENYKINLSPIPREVATSDVILEVIAAFMKKAVDAGQNALDEYDTKSGAGKQATLSFGKPGKTGKAAPSEAANPLA